MNPAATLENLLTHVSAQSVTNVFFTILLAVLVFAILSSKWGRHGQLVQYTPNLLTSLGILGTFVGIVIGLIGFDTGDIDNSIGPLLAGLKTAFLTSLAGMFMAIVFKFLDSTGLISPPTPKEEPESATPEQVLGSMVRQERALVKLTTAIAGDEETTLISQIRLLRSDQADAQKALRAEVQAQKETFAQFQDRLWSQMETFAEMLSKSATEQVINALKEVITDFNKNLTEQFGDNFKRLDAAVEKLVDWQENYRQQLQEMGEQYAEGVKAIGHTRELVGQIEADTKKIPETMDSLKALLATTQHQLAELKSHLEAFKDMRDRAVMAVPEIQSQVDSIVEDVTKAAKESGNRISEVTESMSKSLITGMEDFQNSVSRTNEGLTTASDALATKSGEISEQLTTSVQEINEHVRDLVERVTEGAKGVTSTLSESNEQLKSQIESVQDSVSQSIEQMNARVEKTMDELTRHHIEAASRASQSLSNELERAVQETGESVNAQLQMIDKVQQEEINRVMNEMGKALAQISNQFTKDYRQLTEQMKTIVNQAGRMQ